MEHVAELDNALFQRTALAKPTSEISALYVQRGPNGMGRGTSRLIGLNRLANIQYYNCKKLGHFARSWTKPNKRGTMLADDGSSGGPTQVEKAGRNQYWRFPSIWHVRKLTWTGTECKLVHDIEKAKCRKGKGTLGGIIMSGSVSNSNHNSSLLYFYVTVLRHSGAEQMRTGSNGEGIHDMTGLKAHVLSDSGASHKFVRPQFLTKMARFTGHTLPVNQDGRIKVTIANTIIEVPLRKVELVLNMNGYIYRG
ncbi:hypothetical protein HOY82DRAFT_601485 [Tuber indicum]|nr:hypothetical protein HOY82DRAFT_601485 [Tuber indicum]